MNIKAEEEQIVYEKFSLLYSIIDTANRDIWQTNLKSFLHFDHYARYIEKYVGHLLMINIIRIFKCKLLNISFRQRHLL